MTAISEVRKDHQALLADYREALREWTEIRAVGSFTSAAAVAATRRIEEIERQLKTYPPEPLIRS